MIQIRWLGAAFIEITHDQNVYLIDPYITRAGLPGVLSGRPVIPDQEKITGYLAHLDGGLRAIIVSHTHIDHALDVPLIAALRPDVSVTGSASLNTLLELSGISGRVEISCGRSTFNLPGDVKLTMIPSRHGRNILGDAILPGDIRTESKLPMKTSCYRMGKIFDIMLELDGKKILHIGSADINDDELDGSSCDILFICVPGWRRVIDYHKRIFNSLKPSAVIPFHFDNFFTPIRTGRAVRDLPFLGMNRFCDEIRKYSPASTLIIPEINRTLKFY